MAEIPRLNGVISALQQDKPAFVSFIAAEVGVAQAINAAPYDGVVFEMEHRPYDVRALRDCLQYMLDRRQILRAGTLAPAVTPFVRIPPNGGETSQWVAKQVLDQGVYGIVWPHVSTVEEARNAVTACRYPRPRSAPYFEPAGQRGDAPAAAARYWGLSQQEYYTRADVWPLNPQGELLLGLKLEDKYALENADANAKVPGIGFAEWGPGDMAFSLGVKNPARGPMPPLMQAARSKVFAATKASHIFFLNSMNADNIVDMIKEGVMIGPASQQAAEIGRKYTKRTMPW